MIYDERVTVVDDDVLTLSVDGDVVDDENERNEKQNTRRKKESTRKESTRAQERYRHVM